MTNKVFFMPFDSKHPNFLSAQAEYGATTTGHNKNKIQIDHEIGKGNQAVDVWYNGKKHPIMSSMNLGEIYIRGHGMPGYKSIEGGRGGERVDFDVVVDRLIKSGLPKTFQGKIKCYNCHSAEDGDTKGSADRELIGPAFARSVANYMYSKGYRACTFYGYFGSIDSFVKEGSSGTHKYARVAGVNAEGKYGHHEVGRAKDARVQFHPVVTFKRPSPFSRLFKGRG